MNKIKLWICGICLLLPIGGANAQKNRPTAEQAMNNFVIAVKKGDKKKALNYISTTSGVKITDHTCGGSAIGDTLKPQNAKEREVLSQFLTGTNEANPTVRDILKEESWKKASLTKFVSPNTNHPLYIKWRWATWKGSGRWVIEEIGWHFV